MLVNILKVQRAIVRKKSFVLISMSENATKKNVILKN